MVLYTDRQTLRVTPDTLLHRPWTVQDPRRAQGGDVISPGMAGPCQQPIVRLETIRERTPVYNLQTDLPNTFFASRFAVHNKGGGCFPAAR